MVRASHTLKRPTSRNHSGDEPVIVDPESSREHDDHPTVSDSGSHPSNAPDKQVTNCAVKQYGGCRKTSGIQVPDEPLELSVMGHLIT